MKLPAHAWRTFWAYHAWAGVATGLVLHLMFVTGAVTLFLAPLKIWEEPVQHRAASATLATSPQALFERGRAAIAALPAAPKRLWLGLPQGDVGVARFQYSDLRTGQWRVGWLDPATGRLVDEREQLSTFVYHLHYLWHPALPELEYLAGLISVAFLLIVVTGVLIHVKDLVRQLVQFRPRAARRVLWSDLHKVLGVMGLPFQVLYCYTGALLVFGPVLITALSGPVFGGDPARAAQVAWNEPLGVPKVGGPAAARSLDEVLSAARTAVPGFAPISFGVQDYGKSHGLVRAYGAIRGDAGAFRNANVLVDQETGAVLHVDAPSTELASHTARRWLSGLHYTYFGGAGLRVVLALLALAASGTILSGNWIWLARRRARGGAGRPHLLARLTAGAGAGVFVAIAALFVASRALPFDWAARGAVEQLVFAAVLVGCVMWALVARSADDMWWQQLGMAGLLLSSVPLWAARVSPAGLLGGGPHVATVVAVDAGVLGSGVVLLGAAWALRRMRRQAVAAANDSTDDVSTDDASTGNVSTDASREEAR
jgi:uncharacterized iron-regulated membrane protein